MRRSESLEATVVALEAADAELAAGAFPEPMSLTDSVDEPHEHSCCCCCR